MCWTMTTLAPSRPGRPLTSAWSAPGPPVDEAITTRRWPRWRVAFAPAAVCLRRGQRCGAARRRALAMTEEACLGHRRGGPDLGHQVVADPSDVDRERPAGLGHEVDRARLERVERDRGAVAGEAREHDDARRRLRHETAEHRQAVHDRHLDVERDDVGPERAARLEAQLPVARGAHDLDPARLGQESAEGVAHERRVVDDEDADRWHLASHSRWRPGSASSGPASPDRDAPGGWSRVRRAACPRHPGRGRARTA